MQKTNEVVADTVKAKTPRLRRWLIAIVVVALVFSALVPVSRSTILVGHPSDRSQRVACSQISHESWDELLRHYVDSDGNVDYSAWKESPSDLEKLNDYLATLSRLDESRAASKSERLAFWINAYNAVTVLGILREYPTSSIQNHTARVWGYNIWRDLKLVVGDKTYSLGEIEHRVLRPLDEPRIHFAIVCASRGCPRLRNEAYLPERLDEQLDSNSIAFFADLTKCRVNPATDQLWLSPILKWYAADFGQSTSAILQRITNWLPPYVRAFIKRTELRTDYLDYDWNLNDQATALPPLPPMVNDSH